MVRIICLLLAIFFSHVDASIASNSKKMDCLSIYLICILPYYFMLLLLICGMLISLFAFMIFCCAVQAFCDVEKDLTERETPMDRLICGDVGFGKTEVALRAIFCVVSAGKQAMVLAPTIVLAKQHFDVISERFSCYPNISVGLLSRFQVCRTFFH